MPSVKKRLIGLDLLRIFAMAGIVFQHLLPIYDQSPRLTDWIDVGQFGVTLFCGLSGYLILNGTAKSATRVWLLRRFTRLFPAYWIALTCVFLINAVFQYKPVTAPVVVLEYLGLAGLVDGEHRIGQPFWFITLIIACYLIAAVVRRYPSLMIPLCVGMAILLSVAPIAAKWYCTHLLTFLFGGVLANHRQRRTLVLALVLSAVMVWVQDTRWIYALAGTICIAGFQQIRGSSPEWLAYSSDRTYEFFLVHGTVYLGLARIANVGITMNAIAGTLIGIMAAAVLAALTDQLVRWSTKLGNSAEDRTEASDVSCIDQ